jgi:3-oxoacyl-[acyl-carrier-protein] synthase II
MPLIASITGIGWVTSASMGGGREHKPIIAQDGKLPKLTSRMIFGKSSIHFGRLDDYSKLGFAAVTFALKDAKLDQWSNKRPIGIVASTTYGCLATDIDYYETVVPKGGAFASPSLFAYTLPNVYLGEVATRFGLTGQTFVVNEPELSGIAGLRMALNSIALGDCPVMLAGLCDTGRPDFFDYPTQISSGALFFVLEKTPEHKNLSYGDLDMDIEGAVFFKGAPVENLQNLMQRCIAVLSI